MFSYLPQVKLALSLVAGLGMSQIVSSIVKNNVAMVTPFQKVTVATGSFVLGSMLMDQSTRHIEQQIDSLVSWIEKRKAQETETLG